MNDDEADRSLFFASTAVMVIGMAMMIEKMGTGLATAFRHRNIDTKEVTSILIEVTILLTSICVLVTLVHLHRGTGLRYRRHYFFMDVLSGALLLSTAFTCVHESTFNQLELTRHADSPIDEDLIGKGLTVLSLAFVVLVVRALMAYTAIPRPDQRRKILWVVPFHLSGIALAVVATKFPNMLLVVAAVGAGGAMVYLALFWVLRLQISVEA